MKTILNSSPIRRFAAVLTVMGAITVAALAPALVVSLVLTQDSEITDVTAIDPESTVKYTASPLADGGDDSDIEIFVPADMADAMVDGDLIKVTVIDRGTDYRSDRGIDFGSSSSVDTEMEEGCRFTLSLTPDDRSNNRIGTYSGYIRIKDDDTFTATYTHDDLENREDCGLNLTFNDQP